MIGKFLLFGATNSSANINIQDNGGSASFSTGLPKVAAGTPELQSILTITFGIIAAIAVLIIVVAGFKYVTSEGKSENTAKARETIIYAVVGLVISLSAEAIVAFVLKK